MISNTSSTYRRQSFGLRSRGAVAMASFSNHSKNRLATMADTGLPMAAPKICL